MFRRFIPWLLGLFLLAIPLYRMGCSCKEVQMSVNTDEIEWRKSFMSGGTISRDFFGAEFMCSLGGLEKYERFYVKRDITTLIEQWSSVLKDMGVGIIGIGLKWSEVEPRPPVSDVRHYDWSFLDAIMRKLHKNGMNAKIQVFTESKWASINPQEQRAPVKKEHLPSWYEFIENLVERYDGDGKDDAFQMESALLRILVVSGEVEALPHWSACGGTAQDYDSFLSATTERVKRASNEVLVARAGTNFGRFFDAVKQEDSFNITRKRLSTEHKKWSNFFQTSLSKEDEYDLFGVQLNYAWWATPRTINFVRNELNRYGYDKSLYCNHARSTETSRGKQILRVMLNSKRSEYEAARDAWWATQASVTVKKLILGLASGLRYMGVCTIFDFMIPADLLEAKDAARALRMVRRHPRHLTWSFCGLFSGVHTKMGESAIAAMKPVLYSYGLVVGKLTGANREVAILSVGKDIYGYRFTKNGKPIYVLWCGDYRGAGNRVEKRKVKIPVSSKLLLVTQLVTEPGKRLPETEEVKSQDGEIELALSNKPIFVEEL